MRCLRSVTMVMALSLICAATLAGVARLGRRATAAAPSAS